MATFLLPAIDTHANPEKKVKVLLADDEPAILTVLSYWLNSEGYTCVQARNGLEAWELLREGGFTLLISDIMMPGMSGMALLEKAREYDDDLAVIMVTGVDDRSVAIRALQLGAYGYIIKPFDQNEVLIQIATALERRQLICARKAYEYTLEQRIRERTVELRSREAEITMRLVAAAEFRDGNTGLHIRRMARYATAIALVLGWLEAAIDDLRLAAPMHDIGKIGISDQILLKRGKLTAAEFAIMKRHTEIGAEIIGPSPIPLLQMARDVILCHHERWDGSGYPCGLVGEEIPEAARIVAFANVYDALSSDRVYRPAFPEDEVQAIMTAGNGNQFDPRIINSFPEIFATLRAIRLRMDAGEN